MALPIFTMRQLLEAGVHFGHHPRRWNPKMEKYIFGLRNNIHIIDLQKTYPLLHNALAVLRNTVASGGRVLFVGTKRQASPIIAEAAKRCGQYYVNHRWLGGMMTNWNTISKSIKRLKKLDEFLSQSDHKLTKKELLKLTREHEKLRLALGGIAEMGGLPDILIIVDANKESIAVAESMTLNIPVVGVVDTNTNPENITYPIPGNDDAIKAIELYCDLFADAILDGLQAEVRASGVDMGASEAGLMEEAVMDILPQAKEIEETQTEAPKNA